MMPDKQLKLTMPQLLFTQSRHKYCSLEMGRGSGKSTVAAFRIKDFVQTMPRAKVGIVGSTFQQLLNRTLPSTVEGLELIGFKKGIHYVVGRKPNPQWRWPEAYQPPLTYDNYISFCNGTGFQLISLNDGDSGRGLNLDGVISDESGIQDKEKLDHNVLLSNRGNIHRFKNNWLHHSELYLSTTPLGTIGRWFIELEELARENPKLYMHLIAPSLYNIENLGVDYFKALRRKLTPLTYNAEVMCIRPGRAQTGFYPAFDEKIHTVQVSNDNYVRGLDYNLEKLRGPIPDADVLQGQPLDVAFDYGHKINCLVAGQLIRKDEYRVLNAIFNKSPETVMDLAQQFCNYYSWHNCKQINYYYDHTANYKDPVRTTTFADEVTKVFIRNGWRVNRIYVGQAPLHHSKYLFFSIVYSGSDSRYPRITFNQERCTYLTISILQAGAKEGPKGIEKDKSPERREKAVDEETTHLSDAHDTLIFARFKRLTNSTGYAVHAVA